KIRVMWGRSDLWRGSRTERRGRSEDARYGPRRGVEALMSLDGNWQACPDIARTGERMERPADQAVIVTVAGRARGRTFGLDMEDGMLGTVLSVDTRIRNGTQPCHEKVEEQEQQRGMATPGGGTHLQPGRVGRRLRAPAAIGKLGGECGRVNRHCASGYIGATRWGTADFDDRRWWICRVRGGSDGRGNGRTDGRTGERGFRRFQGLWGFRS